MKEDEFMREVELTQGSDAWIQERKKMIGGSDVSAVLNISPWRTAYQLWEEKTGRGKEESEGKDFIFARGHRYEEKARGIYQRKHGIEIPPKVVKREDTPYCMVSLDGLNLDRGTLVEIKYVSRDVFTALREGAEVKGRLEYYYAQMQYQMYATGLEICQLVVIAQEQSKAETEPNPDFTGIQVIPVYADKPYMVKIIKACDKFWKCVVNDTPPPLTNKDFLEVKDRGLIGEIEKYRKLTDQLATIKSMVDQSKEKIKGLMKHDRMIAGKVKLTKSIVPGRVDYKSLADYAVLPDGVNVDEFKGCETTRFTITLPKGD